VTRRLDGGPVGAGPGGGGPGGGGTDLSPVTTISNRDELVAASTTIAPTFTLDGRYLFPDIFPLNAGEKVLATDNSFLSAVIAGGGGFTGDVDAPLLSGPLRVDGLSLSNANTGANAYHFEMTSASRPMQIYDCEALGPAGGLLVKDALAAAIRDFTHAIPGGVRGIVLDGTLTQVAAYNVILSGNVAGWKGVELLPTATVGLAVVIVGPAIVLQSTQSGFSMSDAATIDPGAQLIVAAAVSSGDQALLWDQSPGTIPLSALELIVDGSTSGNWSASAAVGRSDLLNPLLIAYPAFPASAPTPLPYKDGVVPAEIDEVNPSVRWRLVKDDPAPGDWYMEFLGPKVDVPHRVGVDVLVDRASNTRSATILIEKALAATPTTWATIPSTLRIFDNTSAFKQQARSAGEEVFSAGDRLRPASQNLVDAVAARMYDVVLTIEGS